MMPSIFDMNRSGMQKLPHSGGMPDAMNPMDSLRGMPHQSEQVGQQQMPELAQQPDPEEAKKKKVMMAQMLSGMGNAFAPQQDLELQQLQGVVNRPFEFQPPPMQFAQMAPKRKMMGF